MQVKVKKLKPEAIIPCYAHPDDAGLDLRALDSYLLQPGERKFFDLGFALEFPAGCVAVIKDRGSLGRQGVHTLAGVFDAGYRGEYNVLLVNLSQQAYQVNTGDRIAQLVILPIIQAELIETEQLTDTSRGAGRFGSTGK